MTSIRAVIDTSSLVPTRMRRDLQQAAQLGAFTFEVVSPVPPYPPAWDTLTDIWDHPIWAAAKLGKAQYVISENTHDYPPAQADGRHAYEEITYLGGEAFLALLDA